MTAEQVMRALVHLVAATPGWSDETVDEYAAQLIDLADPDALEEACKSIVRAWTDRKYRVPLATILDSYDRELVLRSPRAIDSARVHCDGSGWRPARDNGYMTPCERCNPALAEVFTSTVKLERWSQGTPIEALDVGVERVHGRLRYRDRSQPPTCYPAIDGDEFESAGVNVAQAWRGYAEEVAEHGREPARTHFEKLLKGANE